MQENKRKIFNALKLAGFSLYFVILFVERLLAMILSAERGAEYSLSSGNVFNYIAFPIAAIGLAAGSVLFIRLFVGMIGTCRARETYSFDLHAREWVFAATALLFSGMMHTGFTLAGMQFAAYGCLIAAMIVRCVEGCSFGEDRYQAILSVVYLTLFSMAIPVCYISFLSTPLREIFFAAEFAAVFVLVPIFGVMLYPLMKRGYTSFSPIFPAVMAVLSGAVVALKWTEEINFFVLIFASLTLVTYLAFGLIAWTRSRRNGTE